MKLSKTSPSKINSKETSGGIVQWNSSILGTEGDNKTTYSLLRAQVPAGLASSRCSQDQLLCASLALSTLSLRAPISTCMTLPRP